MNGVPAFLLVIAAIFVLGAVGEAVFRRTQIPDVVWLLLAGIVVGPVTGLVSRDELSRIAPYFAAITLVVILFEGGSRLKLADIARSAPRSGVLAVASFGLAMVGIAGMSMAVAALGGLSEQWSWSHGFLLGSILGGSSSIIIMPAMARAATAPRVADLVNLESAFTDALCVVVATALTAVLIDQSGQTTQPGIALAKSLGIGLAFGVTSGAAWLLLLQWLHASEHAYPVTLSALLMLYVVTDHAGGSAALAILAFAVLVGNANAIGRRVGFVRELELGTDLRGFNRQMAFIIKSFFFTFIGAMLGPPWSLVALGIVVGLVLLIVRVPAVVLATVGSDLTFDDKRVVTFALPRGMAAGVLATMPMAAGVPAAEGLPPLVFAAVITSIVIFAVGFPLVLRRSAPTHEHIDGAVQVDSEVHRSTALASAPMAVDRAASPSLSSPSEDPPRDTMAALPDADPRGSQSTQSID